MRPEDRLKISPSTLSTISALKLDNGWHSRSGPENQVADLMPEFGYWKQIRSTLIRIHPVNATLLPEYQSIPDRFRCNMSVEFYEGCRSALQCEPWGNLGFPEISRIWWQDHVAKWSIHQSWQLEWNLLNLSLLLLPFRVSDTLSIHLFLSLHYGLPRLHLARCTHRWD